MLTPRHNLRRIQSLRKCICPEPEDLPGFTARRLPDQFPSCHIVDDDLEVRMGLPDL